MRMTVLTGVALLAGYAAIPTPAAAATYPWCARFATMAGECSFETREQCIETLSGIGGICHQNPGYAGASSAESTGGPGARGPYNAAPRRRRHH
jgi:uncharacterized protein DUF3551